MEQQKVFATAWRGFEKKAVLDYIYEQDVLFKRRLAELEARLVEYEDEGTAAPPCAPAPEPLPTRYEEQIEALELACSEERETAVSLKEKCERLRKEADQFIQVARSKEGELQLQIEMNRQLQQKCDAMESKMTALAEHLIAVRENASRETARREPLQQEASAPDPTPEPLPEVSAAAGAAPVEFSPVFAPEPEPAQKQYTDLKDELNEFRQSVSQTLQNFEAALVRLEADNSEDAGFFR